MSSSSFNQKRSMKKSKKDPDVTPKESKAELSDTKLPAGTSKPKAGRKKLKNSDENTWGFFPQNMWFWKQEESQLEEQIKDLFSTSQHSVIKKNETTQLPVIDIGSQYIWPDAVNIQYPQRLVNQLTLEQIIEQRKLRENQLVFEQEFNKNVDYLGERISKSNLSILIAQLNNILPTSSEKMVDSTKKLTRAKPLQVKPSQEVQQSASKVSKRLTSEEKAQQEQLRQNQLDEYENIRDQIDLFEERSSSRQIDTSSEISKENSQHVADETISKTDLNILIDLLNENPPKEKVTTTLQELVKSKPQILDIVKQAYRNKPEDIVQHEHLKQTQSKEIDEINENTSVPMKYSKADTNMKNFGNSALQETRPKAHLKKILTRLNELESEPEQKPATSNLFSRWRTPERLTPEELERREELRQKQLEEYENLREQIGLFGDIRSDVTLQDRKEVILERKISKKELNSFFSGLSNFKNKQNIFSSPRSSTT